MREHLRAQTYFLVLAAINTLHGLLPFRLRPLLYRLCRYDIAPTATLPSAFAHEQLDF